MSDLLQEHPLRRPPDGAQTGHHRFRRAVPGAGHRRQQLHLQPGEFRPAAQPAAVRPSELVDVYFGKKGDIRYATSSFPDYADLRSWNDVVTDLAAFNVTIATWDNGRRTDCCSASR